MVPMAYLRAQRPCPKASSLQVCVCVCVCVCDPGRPALAYSRPSLPFPCAALLLLTGDVPVPRPPSPPTGIRGTGYTLRDARIKDRVVHV